MRTSDAIFRQFGEGTGAIAIVLDCSGSMIGPTATAASGPTPRQALKQVLKESVPKGTKLSLWTFSQLPEGHRRRRRRAASREATTRRTSSSDHDDLAATPEQTIMPQRTMAAWDPAQVDEVERVARPAQSLLRHPPGRGDGARREPDSDLVKARWHEEPARADRRRGQPVRQATRPQPGGKLTIPAFLAEGSARWASGSPSCTSGRPAWASRHRRTEEPKCRPPGPTSRTAPGAGAAGAVHRGQEPRRVDREPQGGPGAEARLPDPRCGQGPRGRARRDHARRGAEVVGRRAGRRRRTRSASSPTGRSIRTSTSNRATG